MMSRKVILLGFLACLGLAASTATATNFYLHNTLDLSNSNFFPAPLFDNNSPNGTNPSAVTTDGLSLWVAGFNGGTSVASVSGIVRIDNPWGTASATNIFSLSTPASRGFSGMAYDSGNNAALGAFDNGGSSPSGITSWKRSDNLQLWAATGRGSGGVAMDPGFASVDSGAAWSTIGSGRRLLQNASTGATIYNTSNGFIINAGAGNIRDIAFAPNGDIFARGNNNVFKAVRTGGNTATASASGVPLIDLTDAAGVNGQNIAYLNGLSGGDLLIYNDRFSTSFGQTWASGVKLADPATGAPAVVGFFDSIGNALPAGFGLGAGYFDFAWDAANQALIGLDFGNRLVYRFLPVPVPEPMTLVLLGLGAVALRRRHR